MELAHLMMTGGSAMNNTLDSRRPPQQLLWMRLTMMSEPEMIWRWMRSASRTGDIEVWNLCTEVFAQKLAEGTMPDHPDDNPRCTHQPQSDDDSEDRLRNRWRPSAIDLW